MSENEKQSRGDDHPAGRDSAADFVRDLATSAPPKSVETVKAASDAHEKAGGGEHDDRIRRRAYELWEQDGRPHGKHDDYWLQAQAEIAAGGDSGG